jgi:hypothetical protein
VTAEPKPEDAACAILNEISPSNPFRPLDWRMRLAIARVEHPRVRRSRKLDDACVRRAVGHLRAARPRGRRADHDPAIEAATRLRDGDPRLRDELEAWLLTGLGDAEIAARLDLEPGAVGAYATLHYDVRPYLRSRVALLSRTVGPELWERRLDRPGSLRYLAIAAGPLAVARFADHLLGPLAGRPSPPLDADLAELVELHLELINLPINEQTAPRILALHAHQRELERARQSESASAVTRPVLSGPDLARRMHAACAPIDRDPASWASETDRASIVDEPVPGSSDGFATVPRTA